jgi:uncharacterized SAM-binding protein YcdF (DUF218 family)
MDKASALETVVQFLAADTPVDKLPVADAILIFGHIAPRLPRHAAFLYKLGKAPKIVVSGKGRKTIPGYATEAGFYADILRAEAVPERALILEEEAMNTLENVQFGMKAAESAGLHPRRLILVAMPPLLRRAIATFHKQFPDVTVYGSAFELPLSEYEHHIPRLLAEFDRFDEYAKKDDIEEVTIPPQVAEAVQLLTA